MINRGMNHNAGITTSVFWSFVSFPISVKQNEEELYNRCSKCRERILGRRHNNVMVDSKKDGEK
jgi:DNA-directed RNA polymerase subunit RPC12/RpoP